MSSVMYCEALAFVAAQLHAAKCVQRYKCSEIAQALKETPYFLFVLMLNSVYCTFKFVFQIIAKKYCIRLNDWSTLRIGVSYGTIST